MLTSESRAMVATNATFMVLAILSVVLRFQIRRPTAFCLELDDYMILTALVRMPRGLQGVRCSRFCSKFFSIALAVTNIVGVFAAGFGAPFESLSDEKGIAFLKVRRGVFDIKLQVLKSETGLVRAAVLVHPCGSFCEILDSLLLRTTLFRPPISGGGQHHDSPNRCLAGLIPVRYLLPSLAALVQLDRLRANDELPSHVCLLKRDGHCT